MVLVVVSNVLLESGVQSLSDTQNAETIAQVIADYLVDRDDIAAASAYDNHLEVVTQAGEHYLVMVTPSA